jgi:SAM-dependent methyltransferase
MEDCRVGKPINLRKIIAPRRKTAMTFNSDYTEYWKKAVIKSVDGTKIAGETEVMSYLDFLPFTKFTRVLDLGCSFGRMHKVLKKYSSDVYGVDVDVAALEMAKLEGYSKLSLGSTESIPHQDNYFDFVFCWAVFDAVSQNRSLVEIARVLMDGGIVLLTGKNDTYLKSDKLAFTAERNAFLKGHPNNFTDLLALTKFLPRIGFQIERLLIFEKRGDMGELVFRQEDRFDKNPIEGYEFLLICRKITPLHGILEDQFAIASQFSKTAITNSKKLGFKSPIELFLSSESR